MKKILTLVLLFAQSVSAEIMIQTQKPMVALLDGKICQIFHMADSGRAQFTCRTGVLFMDPEKGHSQFTVKVNDHVQNAVPEVSNLNGIEKGSTYKMNQSIEHIEAGEKVRVEAILANGEILIRRTGFLRTALIQTGRPVVFDPVVVRASISYLDLN